MREILFRGMRADNNKWIEGSLIVDYPCCKNKVDESVKQYFILDLKTSDEKVKSIQVIPETIGQYTGLIDKNGKMIFEGDILSTCFGIGVVKYTKGIFIIVLIEHEKEQHTTLFSISNNGKIIGNIHDNPELLKGGEEQ